MRRLLYLLFAILLNNILYAQTDVTCLYSNPDYSGAKQIILFEMANDNPYEQLFLDEIHKHVLFSDLNREYYYDYFTYINGLNLINCDYIHPDALNNPNKGTFILEIDDFYVSDFDDYLHPISAISIKHIWPHPIDDFAFFSLEPSDEFKNGQYTHPGGINYIMYIDQLVESTQLWPSIRYKVSPPTATSLDLENIEGNTVVDYVTEGQEYKVLFNSVVPWDRCELWISKDGGASFEKLGNNFGSNVREALIIPSFDGIEPIDSKSGSKEIILRVWGYQSEDTIVGKSPSFFDQSFRVFEAPMVSLKNEFRYCHDETSVVIQIDNVDISNNDCDRFDVYYKEYVDGGWGDPQNVGTYDESIGSITIINSATDGQRFLITVRTSKQDTTLGLVKKEVTVLQREDPRTIVPNVITFSDLPGEIAINDLIDEKYPPGMSGELVEGNLSFIPQTLDTYVYFRDLDPKCQETKFIQYRTKFPYIDLTANVVDTGNSLFDDVSVILNLEPNSDNNSEYALNGLINRWSLDGFTWSNVSLPLTFDTLDRTKNNIIPIKIKFIKQTGGIGKEKDYSAIDDFEITIPKYPGTYFEASVSQKVTGCTNAHSGEILLENIYHLTDGDYFKVFVNEELFDSVPYDVSGKASSTQIISDIPAGEIITVAIKDGGAYTWSDTIQMEVDTTKIVEKEDISYIVQNITRCSYDKTGSFEVVVDDGDLNYIYETSIDDESWQLEFLHDGLGEGDYKIYTRLVAYPDDCKFSVKRSITAPGEISLLTTSTVDPICSETNTGAIDLEFITNNNTPLREYRLKNNTTGESWSSPVNSLPNWSFEDLPAGNYQMYTLDLLGCSTDTLETVLTDPAKIVLGSHSTTPVTCNGENSGAIFLNNISGSAPYKISVNGFQLPLTYSPNVEIPNLSAGKYRIKISNFNDCDGPQVNIAVEEPDPFEIVFDYQTYNGYDIKCNGQQNNINIFTTGGNGQDTIFYNDNSYTNPISDDLPAGSYEFSAVDVKGCADHKTLLLVEPDSLKLIIDNITEPTCSGSEDGSIELHGEGGVSVLPYYLKSKYLFQDSIEISPSYTNDTLIASRYYFAITDANGCRSHAEGNWEIAEVETTDPIEITIDNFSHPLCAGSADGTLSFNVSHTLTTNKAVIVARGIEIVYSGSLTSGTVNLDNLTEGIYTISVIEEGTGCSATTSIELNDPEPLTYTFDVTDVTCFGDTDGIVNIQPFGGTASYIVQINGASNYSDNGVGTINFSNLIPGTYSIALTDQNNCVSTSVQGNSFTVREPEKPLTLNLSFTQPTCNGDADGAILSVAGGGWQDYAYSKDSVNWNASADFTFDNLTAGDYRIFVRDTQSCVTAADITVIEPAVLDAFNVMVTDANCPGSSDGSFEVLPTGGNGGYLLYYESSLMPDLTVNDLPEGTYDYMIEDQKGCQDSANAAVNDPDDFSHSVSLNDYNSYHIRCNGLTDTVEIQINGGSPGYTIQTGGFGFAEEVATHQFDVNSLVAGDYTFTFTDAHGCDYETPVSLTEPTSIVFENINIVDASCHNYSDGIITGEIHGGVDYDNTDHYDLEFSGQQTGAQQVENGFNFSGLHSGGYLLVATDSNGCAAQLDTVVQQPEPITAVFESNSVVCKGDSNGSVNINVDGGTPDFNYQWFNESDLLIANTKQVQNLAAGIYRAVVTDKNGCTMADSLNKTAEVIEPDLTLSLTTQTNPVRCYGESNGEITLAGGGGWSNYSYADTAMSWTQIDQFTGLPAGIHRFFVRDNRNCVDSIDVEMTQPDTLVITDAQVTQPLCYGDANGTVNIAATGGNGGYEYLLAGQTQNNALFTGIEAGDYTIEVTDVLGCVDSYNVVVGQPDSIAYMVESLARPTCERNDGAISLSASGGTGTLSIDWIGDTISDNYTIVDLYAGTYGFVITDDNNCLIQSQVVLNNIDGPELSVNELVMPQCSYSADGSIMINITGQAPPFNVEWINGTDIIPGYDQIENVAGGTYLVSVRDTNNCFYSQEIVLPAPTPVSTSIMTSPVVCKGDQTGLLQLNLDGGVAPYTSLWSTDGSNWNTFDAAQGVNLGAGSYQVKVEDAHNCFDATSIVDGVLAPVEIVEPNTALALSANADGTSCFNYTDGKVVLTGIGGWQTADYEYALNNGDFTTNRTFSNLVGGVHSAQIKDTEGCVESVDFEVVEPDELIGSVSDFIDVRCNGESTAWVQLASVGGTLPYYYQMNGVGSFDEQYVFDQLSANDYTFVIKDVNECRDTLTWTVNQPDSLLFANLNGIPSFCLPGTGEVEIEMMGGTAPYFFSDSSIWFDTNLTINNMGEGDYSIQIEDTYACQISGNVHIDFVPGTQLSVDNISEPLCYGASNGAVSLSVAQGTPPYNVWLNGNLNPGLELENLSAGAYRVLVSDQNECADSTDIVIEQPDSLYLNINKAFDPVCFNEPTGYIETQAMGGTTPYAIVWSNATTSFTPDELLAGTYSFEITDGNNCLNTGSVTLENPDPIVTILPDTMHLCANQTKMLDAVYENFTYMWYKNDELDGNAREYEVTEAGEYTLQLFSPEGCNENDTTLVIEYEYEADAFLLMPTAARVNDTVIMIDISWPIPDSLDWIVPSSFNILAQQAWEVHTQPTLEGGFMAGIITYTGNCVAEHYKPVTIEGFNNGGGGKKSTDVFAAINMAPNPARENALVVTEMGDMQPLEAHLLNSHGNIIQTKEFGPANRHQWNIDLNGLGKGVYFVRLKAQSEQRYLKLVVI
jgi:hypothetical protein